MICCDSGSHFGKVFISVPDPEIILQFSKNKKISQNLAFLISEATYFPKRWPLIFDFFFFFIPFMLGCWPGSKSGSGTVMHSGSGSAKAKSYGSCGSGSTTLTELRSGVSDPYSFYPDPDPHFEAGDQYGSGSGSNPDSGL
jgi:hypothetical protein